MRLVIHSAKYESMRFTIIFSTFYVSACMGLLANNIYVATNGNDAWSGLLSDPNQEKTDGPFASLERARNEIRALKQKNLPSKEGITVLLRQGIYSLNEPFELNDRDSGTPTCPISYRAYNRERVRVIGGKSVSGFQKVIDANTLNRLPESARGQVYFADLRSQGITQYGSAGESGLELFFQNKPMVVSRWPNDQFIKIVAIAGQTVVDVRGTKGCVEGIFNYDSDRPNRWTNENDIWVHGYWFWDWSDQRQRVSKIDTEKRQIEIAPPYHNYGYRKGQWFYAFNLLSEIDQPGEWYLDRQSGLLYFWPPAALSEENPLVSVLDNLLVMKNVSHVSWRDITFEATRKTPILMSGGVSNRIVGCTLRNMGGSAISVSGGQGHSVIGCDVYNCGSGGISLSGGERKTLTPAGHSAENNHVHHYGRWKPMYSAGISISGVGNRVAHNLIENAPHQAMSFSGNDHVIELNEIHSVCFESNDAGAIYSGRDWTMRGTVIRNNYLHDITGFEGKGCVGVYLDDMYCGTEISGNLFYRVTRAAFIGGGRDCSIVNNIFVECNPTVHIDARAMGWAKYHADEWVKEGREKGTLSGTKYKEAPYSVRYPVLVSILDDNPFAPKGNQVIRNICVGGKWDGMESRAKQFAEIRDNFVNIDPLFVNPASMDFQLRSDSPALSRGFKPIPLHNIGLYMDEFRASWPVIHSVRPVHRSQP